MAVIGGLVGVVHVWPIYQEYIARKEDITATVAEFDVTTGGFTLRLDNNGYRSAFLQGARITVQPPLGTPQKDYSPTKGFPLPGKVGIAFREGRLPCWMATLTEAPPIAIEKRSHVVTNLVPQVDSFRAACGLFPDQTPLEIGINFIVVDSAGRSHDVDLSLGTYRFAATRATLESTNMSRTVRLLPSAERPYRRVDQGVVTVTGTNWTGIIPVGEPSPKTDQQN